MDSSDEAFNTLLKVQALECPEMNRDLKKLIENNLTDRTEEMLYKIYHISETLQA